MKSGWVAVAFARYTWSSPRRPALSAKTLSALVQVCTSTQTRVPSRRFPAASSSWGHHADKGVAHSVVVRCLQKVHRALKGPRPGTVGSDDGDTLLVQVLDSPGTGDPFGVHEQSDDTATLDRFFDLGLATRRIATVVINDEVEGMTSETTPTVVPSRPDPRAGDEVLENGARRAAQRTHVPQHNRRVLFPIHRRSRTRRVPAVDRGCTGPARWRDRLARYGRRPGAGDGRYLSEELPDVPVATLPVGAPVLAVLEPSDDSTAEADSVWDSPPTWPPADPAPVSGTVCDPRPAVCSPKPLAGLSTLVPHAPARAQQVPTATMPTSRFGLERLSNLAILPPPPCRR